MIIQISNSRCIILSVKMYQFDYSYLPELLITMGGEVLQFTKKKGNTLHCLSDIFYLRKFNSLMIAR